MPIEILLIGIAAIAAAIVLVPALRRLAWTFVDVVDASVAMFTIRRALGLDTTTARERRIERRRAREQAEIARRIGATGPGAAPAPSAPTRLVVSGSGAVAGPAAAASTADGAPPAPRTARQNLRDGVLAAVAVVVVGLVLASWMETPDDGDVLGATSAPTDAGVARVTAAPTATDGDGAPAPRPTTTPGAAAPLAPTPTPMPSPTATPDARPVATDLAAGIDGGTAGRSTIDIELSWALAADGGGSGGLILEASVDDGPFEVVDELPAAATSAIRRVELGRTSVFRLSGGTATAPVDWAPITAARTQESSSRVRYAGAWRSAAGPSLLGGTVRFARERGATARFTFSGTDVAWVATRTPMSGRAEVRIDGRRVATIDLAASSVQYRRLVFRHQLDAGGRHDLEIRALGDGRVDLDAFVVLR